MGDIYINITVSTSEENQQDQQISISTNLDPVNLNYWLDQAKYTALFGGLPSSED